MLAKPMPLALLMVIALSTLLASPASAVSRRPPPPRYDTTCTSEVWLVDQTDSPDPTTNATSSLK